MQILASTADVMQIGKGPRKPLAKDYSSVENLAAHMVQYLREWWAEPEQTVESEFQPMLIAVCKNGDIVPIVVSSDFDADGKDAFADQCRTMFELWDVERYVFTSEAWMAPGRIGASEGLPRNEMPSQREDRMEVVIVTAVERERSIFICLEMVRDWITGKITDLREVNYPALKDGACR